ncbi:type 2 lanthipeptide synthetase LanM family protein [Rhizobium sp. RU36D]|uniref:type 2 lanthipeptide synthetase LanM family protein n=1 Tax=Rhizobium sp. RU36D TaxID=1907415 RepID=UPI0009D7A20F|nr:type 2 lanthipeptide synthetase LanM family protein [Rhizobium sp. RU36D]SMC70521.1 type 2 lantibiotic biosynthesis protein LanM [Rhizobium sp. RU36D]
MPLREEDIPFGAILRSWLDSREPALPFGTDGLLSETARYELQLWQLTRFADVAVTVLLRLFEPSRVLPPLARLTLQTPASAPTSAHDRFIADINARGLEDALKPWPLLINLLRHMADDSHAAMSDFLRHLDQDQKRLRKAIPGWHRGIPKITGVTFGLSDPHGGGRTVGQVRFADGIVLAYKPRSLAVDAAFYGLVEEVNAEGGAPRQRVPWIMDCRDHGWMEWVTPEPMRSRREAVAFYRRCGGLLALIRAVRGGDIHPDNLIAAGAFPVILDLECLFQPGPADLGMADPLLDPILFQAGITPVFSSFDGGKSMVRIAAAGTSVVAERPQRRIVHAGTDWMHEAEWPVPAFDGPGPMLDGERLDVRDFSQDFAWGYRQTLAVVARRQADWWGRGHQLDLLSRTQMRFLAAPTNLYALILEHLRQRGILAEQAALARTADRLAARQPLMTPGATWNTVTEREKLAIARYDVPAFRYQPTRRALRDAFAEPAGSLPGRPMIEKVRADLAGLTPAMIREETRLLTASLARPGATAPRPAAISARDTLVRLTDRIAELAVPAAHGVQWVRMWEQMPALVAPAGPSLAYGATGIALALASAARTLQDDCLALLARQSLAPWTGKQLRDPAVLAARLGPGWSRGIGGMIAALVWCAERLELPGLLEDASRLALSAKHALRVAPAVPDVMDGTTGLLLGLCVLHRSRPDAGIMAAMHHCGQDILRRSTRSEKGIEWQDRGRAGLSGLSHGAGGIAAALAHLAEHDQKDQSWREAVRQALAYEDSLFDPERRNWRTPGNSVTPFKSTWCHGAPGIALARQSICELLPDLTEAQTIPLENAMATARQQPIDDVDDLCCGEAGRLDILLTLSARRGDAELKSEAEAALTARLPDWASGRSRLMAAQAGAPDDPSLLRGLGGPAHVLIRHLASENAADVLLPFIPPPLR